jgi:hypothetical protein
MIKGEIYKGCKTKHPIVFLKEENQDQFKGCILTHATRKSYKDNISLSSKHFEELDNDGKKFESEYSNSYFVNVLLIKKNEWGPFTLTGKLTSDGIKFIETYLQDKKPFLWDEYISK